MSDHRLNSTQRKAVRACRTQEITDCGISFNTVQSLVGNPAGTAKADETNPNYRGKVVVHGKNIAIDMTYVLTGNIKRAEAAKKNIVEVFKKGGININFTANPSQFDIRIHGANLAELVSGLKLCDCETALHIGGWGPSYKHIKWGNALLVNATSPIHTWEISDAHEFGHKLGLRHREDKGIMDYAPEKGRDIRRLIETDKLRIKALYQ